MTAIYKLLRAAEWAAFEAAGNFPGSADDLRDGYIHMSAAEQLDGTRNRYFAGEAGLVLLTLDAETLGDDLRWEEARAGQLFPHLYRPLLRADIAAVTMLAPPLPG